MVTTKIKKIEQKEEKAPRYFEGRGGRKTAIARVRLYSKKGDGVVVNGLPVQEYFKLPKHQQIAVAPIAVMNMGETLSATAHVRGGGISAQAEAVRHGMSIALTKFNVEFRKRLSRVGFLTRDARVVERKKPGLKKARKAPQWAKR